MSATAKHEHAYRMVAHIDACHSYRSVYGCECGATVETYNERNPEGYGQVWMRDDDGSPMCGRCAELLDGAEPRHERTEASNQDTNPHPTNSAQQPT